MYNASTLRYVYNVCTISLSRRSTYNVTYLLILVYLWLVRLKHCSWIATLIDFYCDLCVKWRRCAARDLDANLSTSEFVYSLDRRLRHQHAHKIKTASSQPTYFNRLLRLLIQKLVGCRTKNNKKLSCRRKTARVQYRLNLCWVNYSKSLDNMSLL